MRLAAKITAIVSALLITGGVVSVEARANSREAQAEIDYPPEGQFVMVDGRRVHVVVAGTGPDLVLIHGSSGNTRDFTFGFMGLLTDRYRVIIFDRPGMGYTDRTRDGLDTVWGTEAESPREQADMLQAAAMQLGAEKPIVLGHSYGASVAMAWAVYHPDNIAGLIDVSGATMPWPGALDRSYRIRGSALGGALIPPLLSAFATENQIEGAVAGVFAPNPVPPGYAAYIGTPLTLRRESFRANARQVNTLRPYVVEMMPLYPQIDVPTEILHGDLDTIVPMDIHSEPLSRLIPGAVLTILRNVGHMPHHVMPQAVVAAIDRVAARAGLR